MLRVALPHQGALADPAAAMMRAAGYRQRSDVRELSVLDADNEVAFSYLHPKDIPTSVGSGHLHLGVTEHHLIQESGSPVQQVLPLGFGAATFGYATHERHDWKLDDLEGKTIATCHPWLVRTHLAAERLHAQVITLDGAVPVAVHVGLADAIVDVVCADMLARHRLVAIGEPIAQSQAALIEREPRADRPPIGSPVFVERLRGVVYAGQYLMLDYDCPKMVLEQATQMTPGVLGTTVAPLADQKWVRVRAMVPQAGVQAVMDRLAAMGARAILTTQIRSCRAVEQLLDNGSRHHTESTR